MYFRRSRRVRRSKGDLGYLATMTCCGKKMLERGEKKDAPPQRLAPEQEEKENAKGRGGERRMRETAKRPCPTEVQGRS